MLSESAKERFKSTIEHFRQNKGAEAWMIEMGPVKLVQVSIDQCPVPTHPDCINMKENQQEAEQYVAGLLGMM